MITLSHAFAAIMKPQFLSIIIILFLLGCSTSKKSAAVDKEDITLTDASELDKYVGKEICIVGEVSNTKIPQILGVDVVSENPDLRGSKGMACGVLVKWIVEESEVDPYTANRGAGTFYQIVHPETRATVQVDIYLK